MAWISTIPEQSAKRPLSDLYAQVKASRGKVSNILKVHSLNPPSMRAHLELYDTLMFGLSGLKRVEREMIGVVVSATNQCAYCVRHHAEAVQAYWKDEDRVAQLVEDYTALGLTEQQAAMLDYAVALTTDPAAVEQDTIETLRAAGWGDEDILNINLVASYFNFVNRIAEGLGVEFSESEAEGYNY